MLEDRVHKVNKGLVRISEVEWTDVIHTRRDWRKQMRGRRLSMDWDRYSWKMGYNKIILLNSSISFSISCDVVTVTCDQLMNSCHALSRHTS